MCCEYPYSVGCKGEKWIVNSKSYRRIQNFLHKNDFAGYKRRIHGNIFLHIQPVAHFKMSENIAAVVVGIVIVLS